jgi:hypothetical protein
VAEQNADSIKKLTEANAAQAAEHAKLHASVQNTQEQVEGTSASVDALTQALNRLATLSAEHRNAMERGLASKQDAIHPLILEEWCAVACAAQSPEMAPMQEEIFNTLRIFADAHNLHFDNMPSAPPHGSQRAARDIVQDKYQEVPRGSPQPSIEKSVSPQPSASAARGEVAVQAYESSATKTKIDYGEANITQGPVSQKPEDVDTGWAGCAFERIWHIMSHAIAGVL